MRHEGTDPLLVDCPEIAPLLLSWYGQQGRGLPWRQTRDPYRIWLSEIMLQQTTVTAVIPYYERFLAVFPTVAELAAADLDQVLELWAGLGYYSRARNLHLAACRMVDAHAGVVPQTLEGLMALPGIGRSTAGAILSIAFEQPAPILDGNVRRVLVRLFAWQDDPRSSRAERQLWLWAEALTSREHPHDYAQAIMDLGALLCTPRQPLCAECPLRQVCRANGSGLAGSLPVKRCRKVLPTRHQVALLLEDACGRMLVSQRPFSGLLGGMWQFPVADIASAAGAVRSANRLLGDLGLAAPLRQEACLIQVYSHFRLHLTVFCGQIEGAGRVAEGVGQWLGHAELARLPLHGVQRRAYRELSGRS